MSHSFNENRTILTYNWPDGPLLRDLQDSLAVAGHYSIRSGTVCTVNILDSDVNGQIQPRMAISSAQHTNGWPLHTYDPVNVTVAMELQDIEIIVCAQRSPFYAVNIPGVLKLLGPYSYMLNREYSSWRAELTSILFNYERSVGVWSPPTTMRNLIDGLSMASWAVSRTYKDFVTRKYVKREPIDMLAVLTKLFGEKLAATILKEITNA